MTGLPYVTEAEPGPEPTTTGYKADTKRCRTWKAMSDESQTPDNETHRKGEIQLHTLSTSEIRSAAETYCAQYPQDLEEETSVDEFCLFVALFMRPESDQRPFSFKMLRWMKMGGLENSFPNVEICSCMY